MRLCKHACADTGQREHVHLAHVDCLRSGGLVSRRWCKELPAEAGTYAWHIDTRLTFAWLAFEGRLQSHADVFGILQGDGEAFAWAYAVQSLTFVGAFLCNKTQIMRDQGLSTTDCIPSLAFPTLQGASLQDAMHSCAYCVRCECLRRRSVRSIDFGRRDAKIERSSAEVAALEVEMREVRRLSFQVKSCIRATTDPWCFINV